MKLSTKAKYGLKACFVLALNYAPEKRLVSLTQIDKETGISDSYLEQLFMRLKRAGIVEAARGASGGYCLAEPPAQISIGRVMRALEGDLDIVDCLKTECREARVCPTRVIWKRLSEGFNQLADSVTLQDMVDDYKGADNG